MRNRTLDKRLADSDAEQVRRSHAEAIDELQNVKILDAVVIRDQELADQRQVTIPHKLGRVPKFVCISPIRFPGGATAGQVIENRSQPNDRSKSIVLVAAGFTSTIVVDVMIW